MEEPSVLDYLKSILTFWRKNTLKLPVGIKDEYRENQADGIATREDGGVGGSAHLSVDQASVEPLQAVSEAKPLFSFQQIPWLSLAALLLALIAQKTLEPGTGIRKYEPGAVLYGLSAVAIILSILRGEWSVSPLQQDERMEFHLTFNSWALLVGVLFAFAAFISFGSEVFSPVNLTLWLISLAAFFWSFWQRSDTHSWFDKLRRFFTTSAWSFQLTRWTLVLLAVTLLVICFRVYQIGQIPSEMISDHAEKLLDVNDVLTGRYSIFFPRNTGREAFQFYLTAAIILLFKTGISFISLKIGTVLAGLLTLPYIYFLGKDLANRRAGLFALIFAGIAYWPNVISRFGLRFPLYPLFVAPTFYYLLRGLRRRSRNDFILAGLFLGIGLHGYSPIRVLPVVVVVAVVIYLLHSQSRGARKEAIIGLLLVALISLVVFLPLLRYAIDNPEMFNYRTLTRLGSLERPLPGPALQIFFSNLWNASTMFFWSDGEVWVHSIPLRPALDIVSGALFLLGMLGLLVRYVRQRHWLDLFLIISIPLLMLPSTLSLAFPNENPNLNRTAVAIIPVFIIIGFALDGFISTLKSRIPGWRGRGLALVLGFGLVTTSCSLNYDLVFNQYKNNFDQSAWNASEIVQVMRSFIDSIGSPNNTWTVGYPYWVDTRLVGINAGMPTRDTAIWPDNFPDTVSIPAPKLFLINPEDSQAMDALRALYPQGALWKYKSKIETKDFMIFLVPPPGGAGQ